MPPKKPPEPKWLHAPLKCVIYARVSPRPQPGEISLEKQIDDCGALARLAGWEVVGFFEDMKKSGTSRKDRRLDEAIELCVANNYALVAYDISRISRRFRDLVEILDELETANVVLKVVSGPPIDTSTPMGRMVVRMMISVVAYQRDYISQQTKEALAYRRSKRLAHGGNDRQVWGWKRESLDPLDPGYKRLVPCHWEAKIEAWIAWRAKLGFGPNQLCYELKSRQVHGRGRVPNIHTITKMHKLGLGTNLKGLLPILDVSDLHIHRMHQAGTLGLLELKTNWRRLTHKRVIVHKHAVEELFDDDGYFRPWVGPTELYELWDRFADCFDKSIAPPRDRELLKAMQLYRPGGKDG